MRFVWIWEQTAIISLYDINWLVSVAVTKLQMATINLVMSVHPSVRPYEQRSSRWTDFLTFMLWLFFFIDKIQVSLNPNNNNGTVHGDICMFMVSAVLFSEWQMLQADLWWKSKRTFCSRYLYYEVVTLVTIYEQRWTARYTTDGGIAPRTRIACWITEAADTHSECVMVFSFSKAKMVTRTHTNVTLDQHCLTFYKWDAVCLLRGTN